MATKEDAIGKLFASSGTSAKEFLSIIDQKNIPVYYNAKLNEIQADKVIYEDTQTGEKKEIACDTVLLAMGMLPLTDKVEELRHCCPETNVYIVGDCRKVATISEAVNDAFRACLHI